MSIFAYSIYGILIVALILQPHLLQGHIRGINAAYAQSFSTAVIISIAGAVYIIHQRDIVKREAARQQALRELGKAAEKLNESWQYIALANRRLPLLPDITSNLLAKSLITKKEKKQIFEGLLATAVVSLTGATEGMFRFIRMENGRTVREFIFPSKQEKNWNIAISNRALKELHTIADPLKRLDNNYVLSTTHRDAPIQCHYIFPVEQYRLQKNHEVLQNIIDQTQVLYKYLYL